MNKNSKKVVAGLATGMAVAGIVGGAFAFRQVHPVWNQTTKVATDTKQKQAKKEEITLHYRWTGTETPHIYYENVNGSGDKAISYPGIPMKKTGKDWYSYTISNAKSADIIFSAGENYETATLSREAGEWWLDQDTWYAENPDGSQEENLQLASNQQTASQQTGQNETYSKENVTTVLENGTIKVGKSKITNTKDYIETYVETQDLSATEDASIIIHYYTGGEQVPSIYFWNGLPQDQETVWPGQPMTMEDENWYQYTFNDVNKINFLFTYGMNQTQDFTRKKGEWWYKNGKWYSKKPSDGGSTVVQPIQSEKGDFREESIYFLMTTRFYDGDSSNNVHCWDENPKTEADDPAWRGDFKGLIEKLDYIKALGFSAVWITPVVENASGLDYHGYHAMNFQKVDERYLSDDVSYQTLINEVHKRGMKLVQDVVFNHTGNFGETNLAPMFEKDPTVEGGYGSINCMKLADNTLLPSNYNDSSNFKDTNAFGTWQYQVRLALLKDTQNPIHEGQKNDPKSFYHRFGNGFAWDFYTVQLGQMAGDCVDLNTENPIVAKYITDSYSKYINMGVDAFRVDTVKHISRLTFNNAILPELQAVGGKDFFMFGEVCTKSSQIWYRGETPALSSPFYTWKESKDYNWVYYDETTEDTYNKYAAEAPEKVYSDFKTDQDYFDWRLNREIELGLPHGLNMVSAEENYNDNANDVRGEKVKEAGTAQSVQPVSDNAFLQGNDYHTPDASMASGLNVIDFPMHWNFRNAESAFRSTIGNYDYVNNKVINTSDTAGGDYSYNDATWNVTYVDSHDFAPDGTQAGFERRYNEGEEAWAENLCLLFTFRGIPCIYYGSEIEFQAGKEIDKGASVVLADTGRAYYGEHLEGEVKVSDFGVYEASGNVKETLEAPLSKQLIRLNKIRRAVPALQKGQYSLGNIEYTNIAFKRRYTDDKVDSFVCVSITGSATFKEIPNGTYVDVVTGDTKEVTNGTLQIAASGKGNMRAYVLSTDKTEAPGKVGADTAYLK